MSAIDLVKMPITVQREAAESILSRCLELADALVSLEFELHPELETRYGETGREKALQDASYHLPFLAQAVAAGNPALFADYIGWVKVVLAQRGVLSSDLLFHLQCLRDVLHTSLAAEYRPAIDIVLDPALAALPEMPEQIPSFMDSGSPHAALAHQYLQALLRCDRQSASRIIQDAVDRGIPVKDLYLHVFQRGQYEIGRLWQLNQISVAQEHYCTAATQMIISQLYPRIFSVRKSTKSIVAGCVTGDLHELGGRMIADFFEMAGWNSYYLGASTPPESVVDIVVQKKADVLGISATMTHHVRQVESLISRVRATPECREVIILVGGYPFNVAPDLWQQVGADGHAQDAATVVALAEQLMEQRAA